MELGSNGISEPQDRVGKATPRCYVIAEIGINHDGSINKAREIIHHAKHAGAHAVKFQYRNLDRSYSPEAKEIGDEQLRSEIHRTYIAPNDLVSLAKYSGDIGLQVGISFFHTEDILDFGESINVFDFTKLPSAELTNIPLIQALLRLRKHLYISTGCHSEEEVDLALTALSSEDAWTPLHCISNYPTMLQNSRLGYISYLQRKWNRAVGYSSHDSNWEVCLLAMQLGAVIIERHITLDKEAEGLDHSSSSTPDEFKKLCAFAEMLDVTISGDDKRVPNQGELLNRQNLGRSYFANQDVGEGEVLSRETLTYCAPNTGLNNANIDDFLGKKLFFSVKRGMPITAGLFEPEPSLSDAVIEFSRLNRVALPVRLHDLRAIEQRFPLEAFEFHLSYEEVRSEIDLGKIDPKNQYSIHLPDYISATMLMDPFSLDPLQREASLDILERTVLLAEQLQDRCKQSVPIVGSFSVVHQGLDKFFSDYSQLLSPFSQKGVEVLPQWLPPIAWYFGGSVQLEAMNSLRDVELIKLNQLSICMDVCHLIMGRNFSGFSADTLLNDLDSNIKHIHIADARGIDGEGIDFGDGEPENIDLIRRAFDFDTMKVIEVWQGHLDRGAGFHRAINKLAEFINEKS